MANSELRQNGRKRNQLHTPIGTERLYTIPGIVLLRILAQFLVYLT